MKRSALFTLVLGFTLAFGISRAQQTDARPIDVDRGAAGLARWLRALQTRASFIMVTAHPDDEDGGMLAYETRALGARGVLLTLNRGEGGQNAMSPDMYDRIGLVRTQELLQADRYYGVDQYWTRAIDYGFSKTREEALDKWSHEKLLGDAVRVIRMTRPLVITSVFVGAASDGHGNHQVAGQLAQEAYLAAGDPNRYPEQLAEGLKPWTPLKVYARVPVFAITPQGMYDYAIDKFVPVRFFDYVNEKWSTEKPSTTVEIGEGELSPAAGLTYLQIGREGLNFQKSQNGGVEVPPPGPFASPYHRYGSRVPAKDTESSIFDGIDTSIAGIGSQLQNEPIFLKDGLNDLSALIQQAASKFSANHPGDIAPVLAQGLARTKELITKVKAANLDSNVEFELSAKQSQFEKALTESLGLSIRAIIAPEKEPTGPFGGEAETFTAAIPGQTFKIRTQFFNEGVESVNIESASLAASDGKEWKIAPEPGGDKTVAAARDTRFQFTVTTPADAAITRPYFTRPNEEQPTYDLATEKYRNLPLPPYPLAATVSVNYKGATWNLAMVVQTLQRTPGLGMLTNPLIVAPAISVTLAPSAGAVPLGSKSFTLASTIHSNVKGAAKGTLKLNLPAGWTSVPPSTSFAMARDGEDQTVTFSVQPNGVRPQDYKITAIAEYDGKQYDEGYVLTGYSGLRSYPYYRPAVYHAVGVDVKSAPGLKIGYLPGTGDEVPDALRDLGHSVNTLSANDVTLGNLAGYDAIILGPRAYSVRTELKSANNRLLDYVKNGGVLIVQYNLQGFDRNNGPYPFSLGSAQKVVDEGSKVTLLNPASPAFTWPNKITVADFGGWVEERGHGFMATWDEKYEPLVETHDPEQDPQKGGLLLARYGKGAYIYDAFALYRQLPAGVPGAYRIMANLISLGKNPAFTGSVRQSPAATAAVKHP